MFAMLIANVLGIFILLFLLWRTLKEDYSFEKIFNLGFLILIGYFISLVLSKYVVSNMWFWIILLGIIAGFTVGILKQKMKFFESFEALIVGLLSWVSFVFLSDSINKFSLISFLAFWISFVCIFIFYFLTSHYRSYSWYKSGKVGFAGVITAILFFIFRCLLFLNIYEIIFSGTIVLTLFLLLYKLIIYKE